ncbi:MAG: hypothetical protein GY754_02735 [bacterium]|nr:hypothetical protein [bacterium]
MLKKINFFLILIVLTIASCSGNNAPDSLSQPDGSGKSFGKFSVSPPPDTLDGGQVTKVTISISGALIVTPITQDLVYNTTSGKWEGTISGIPVGVDRVFTADAYDNTNTRIFTGETGGVTVSPGSNVIVAIILQPVAPPVNYENHVPVINSIAYFKQILFPNEQMMFYVNATDNDGDAISYSWSATGGTFSNSDSASTIYTAPAMSGTYDIVITVADTNGQSNSHTVTIEVNNAPTITSVTADTNPVLAGKTASLTVVASDPEGDTLSYLWASKDGSFDNLVGTTVNWTAPGIAGTYPVIVTVTDEHGFETTASIDIVVEYETSGAVVSAGFNTWPQVRSIIASNPQLKTGSLTTALTTQVSDVDGDTLQYTWTSGCPGTFTDSTQPNTEFTADSGLPQGEFCELMLTAEDGEGGEAQGIINIAHKDVEYIQAIEIIEDAGTTVSGGNFNILFSNLPTNLGPLKYLLTVKLQGDYDQTNEYAAITVGSSSFGNYYAPASNSFLSMAQRTSSPSTALQDIDVTNRISGDELRIYFDSSSEVNYVYGDYIGYAEATLKIIKE